MANNKYDIFISYRRDGGAQYACILQLMTATVFLDCNVVLRMWEYTHF